MAPKGQFILVTDISIQNMLTYILHCFLLLTRLHSISKNHTGPIAHVCSQPEPKGIFFESDNT